jgi:hypothetical protein
MSGQDRGDFVGPLPVAPGPHKLTFNHIRPKNRDRIVGSGGGHMTDLSTGNHLFYGDNLDVLRDLPDGFVDLVYLDPPFNSNARDDVRARGG